jgi:hypothetical protein
VKSCSRDARCGVDEFCVTVVHTVPSTVEG